MFVVFGQVEQNMLKLKKEPPVDLDLDLPYNSYTGLYYAVDS